MFEYLLERFEKERDIMVLAEEKSALEFVGRHLLILVVVVVGAFLFSVVFPLMWFVVYFATSLCTISLLRSLRKEPVFRTYLLTLGVYTTRVILFRGLILYLWLRPENAAHYVAMFMLLGSVRYSLNIKSRVASYYVIQSVGDFVILSALALAIFLYEHDEGAAILGGVVAIAIVLYYIVTFFQGRVGLREIEELELRTRQSEKMQAIGRLTGGVAHDFNNILTVIMGNLQLYREMKEQSERDELVDEAEEAARKALLLTSQLLAFSRQSQLNFTDINLQELFEEFSGMARRVLPENIVFKTETELDIRTARSDRAQLETALLNLILNARDAMKKGGTLTISARNRDIETRNEFGLQAGQYIGIDVSDQGDGIERTDINKVFDPYFTTKPVGEGSGMGLPSVKGFTEQSGGGVALSSATGEGTTVTLLLPTAAGVSS